MIALSILATQFEAILPFSSSLILPTLTFQWYGSGPPIKGTVVVKSELSCACVASLVSQHKYSYRKFFIAWKACVVT